MRRLIACGIAAVAGVFLLAGAVACQLAPAGAPAASKAVISTSQTAGSQTAKADAAAPSAAGAGSAVVWGEVPKQCT